MVPSPEIRGGARRWLAGALVAFGLVVTTGAVARAAPDPGKQAERAAKKAEREAKKAAREEKKGEGKKGEGKKKDRDKGATEAAPKAPATKPPATTAGEATRPAGAPKAARPAVPGPGCPPDNALTFRSFGAGFLRTWCTGCHSSSLPASDRQDAPDGVDFDSLALFQPHAQEVLARAVLEAQAPPESASPMPPAGLVPEADRRRLAQWIACGAPAQ